MPDRPFECSKCTKKCSNSYKEINQSRIKITQMCDECPILREKLHGQSVMQPLTKEEGFKTDLCCMSCGSCIETIKLGKTLGCTDCYSVFEDLILKILQTTDTIPEKLRSYLNKEVKIQIHIGKTPYQTVDLPISAQMTELNAALNNALQTENYEQAANLRDQINQLKSKPHE